MHDPKVPRVNTNTSTDANVAVTKSSTEPIPEVDPVAAMMSMGDGDSDLPF
jgi:hypothetical protein